MTTQKHEAKTFAAQLRSSSLGKAGQTRRAGLIPANIFGLMQPSIPVSLSQKEFSKHIASEGESGLIYIDVEGETKPTPVLIDELVLHPVLGSIQHVTLRRVNLKEKVTTEVPLELVGEVEIRDANIVQVKNSVEIEALPTDIPESIEVDLTKLQAVGDQILFADLVFDREKITLVLAEGEAESPVVIVQEVKEEVIEEPVVAEGEEAGEAGAEGEAGEAGAEAGAEGAAETAEKSADAE